MSSSTRKKISRKKAAKLLSSEELDEKLSSVNPYFSKIRNYPGRIYLFEDWEAERAEVCKLVEEQGPVVCELGSGSGGHLVRLAELSPGTPCLGFELRYKRAVRTLEKAEKLGLDNVYVLQTDAKFMDEIFPEGSLAALYVNFPDPWAKPKQWKHRILSEGLLETLKTKLAPQGFLAVKTDHQEYFESFAKIAAANSAFQVVEESRDLVNSPYAEKNILTEFETLFLGQGLPIYYLKLVVS